LLLIVISSFCGCNEISNVFSSEKNKFIGTWETSPENVSYHSFSGFFEITYFSDGTFNANGVYPGTYEIKDSKLVMKSGYSEWVLDYYFSNEDKSFTMIDSIDRTITYHKIN